MNRLAITLFLKQYYDNFNKNQNLMNFESLFQELNNRISLPNHSSQQMDK